MENPVEESPNAKAWAGCMQAGGRPAVPIVLGVVGHREVGANDRERVTQALKDLFLAFRSTYPDTPLVVLSALAEGADQMAARAALDAGAFVRAPLPFPRDAYRQSTSFDTEEARQALDGFLDDPRVESFVVPLPGDTNTLTTDWNQVARRDKGQSPEQTNLRHACYANAGGYIVRRCHALIALWDGRGFDPVRGPSGTAEFVQFKLLGEPPSLYPWTAAEPLGFRSERGLVVAIRLHRNPAHEESPPPIEWSGGDLRVLIPNKLDPTLARPIQAHELPERVHPASRFWGRFLRTLFHHSGHDHSSQNLEKHLDRIADREIRQFREVCTTVDDFNRDIKSLAKFRYVPNAERPDTTRVGHLGPRCETWFDRLSAIRQAAGNLSSEIKPRVDSLVIAFFAVIGLGLWAFHMYAHWIIENEKTGHESHQPAYLLGYLALLAAAVGIVFWVWWRRLEERRLDSRGLAEALRVRQAWAIAGLRDSVADSYLGQLRSEVGWNRQALFHVCPPSPFWAEEFDQLGTEQQLDRLEKVDNLWISGKGGQCAHFHKTCRENHARAWMWRLIGFLLALAGWIMLSVLCGMGLFAEPPFDPRMPPNVLLILPSMMVLCGGLLVAYCERRSHQELAHQFERLAILFDNGRLELHKHLQRGDIPRAQAVIRALGREAIQEHSQWLLIRRSRALELHIG